MSQSDLMLMAHLLRRAGFGASRDELEEYAAMGYEAAVDYLVNPEQAPAPQEDTLRRYYLGLVAEESLGSWNGRWIYRMINSKRPLEEKMALFWHGIFATGFSKHENASAGLRQIEMFRENCLSDMYTILLDLSRNPAMNYWLDNCENHKDSPNENYGRELLELFSMGVGNYSEQDIKMASRAFTGWSFRQPIPLYPFGHYPSAFEYREDDHDDGVKTFLGETGPFNGEDIIDIIVKQPATARFIARHLYNFFVADEPQVPAWPYAPPNDPEAIETLVQAYAESKGNIQSILRALFNSDFFKEAQFKRVKSPVELVVSTIKLAGTHRFPEPGLDGLYAAAGAMGQRLMDPPTVEGWHTGQEWVDGGTLNERVNFSVNELADYNKPGIADVISKLSAQESPLAPQEFVDRSLDLVGPLSVSDDTRAGLLRYAHTGGDLRFGTQDERQQSASRIGRMVQLIAASREFQFA